MTAIRFVSCLLAASILAAQADAQTTGLTLQGPAERSNKVVIKDTFGRPCLDIEAAAKPETVNPKMVDHIVSIKNNCPRLIKAKICYFNSENCNNVELQAYKRVDTILGSMNGVSYFRYTIDQK